MSYKKVIRKVLDNIFLLRLIDKETKFFESLWEIPEEVCPS